MLPLPRSLGHARPVNERVVRRVIGSLVVLAMCAAIAGVIAAHVVLAHGSGTYLALLVFLPLLVGPGVLAWFHPTAKVLAMWATSGWICTVTWWIFGDPYDYERALEHWQYIAISVSIAILLVTFVAPASAILMVKRNEVAAELGLRAQRVRRISVVAIALAAGVAVTGYVRWQIDGFVASSFLLMLILPGAFAIRSGSRAAAFLWGGWCAPFALLAALTWPDGNVPSLGGRIFLGGLGAIFVLLAIGLPIASLAPASPVTSSPARASFRSQKR